MVFEHAIAGCVDERATPLASAHADKIIACYAGTCYVFSEANKRRHINYDGLSLSIPFPLSSLYSSAWYGSE